LYSEKPVNIHQKKDNVSSFLTHLQKTSSIPPSRCFSLSNLFSEPKYLTKVYSCLLSLKRYGGAQAR